MIPSMSFIGLFYSLNIRTTSCSASTPDNLQPFHTPRELLRTNFVIFPSHMIQVSTPSLFIPNDLLDFASSRVYSWKNVLGLKGLSFLFIKPCTLRIACSTLTTERQVTHSQSFDPYLSAYGVAKERNPWLCSPNIPAEVGP